MRIFSNIKHYAIVFINNIVLQTCRDKGILAEISFIFRLLSSYRELKKISEENDAFYPPPMFFPEKKATSGHVSF